MSTSKEIVVEKFPEAESQYNPPVANVDNPEDRDGHWAIYRSPELGTELLGTGPTESKAWDNAAEKISND